MPLSCTAATHDPATLTAQPWASITRVSGSRSRSTHAAADTIPAVIATAVWSGLIGLALNGLFVAFDRRFFRWQHARGGEAT